MLPGRETPAQLTRTSTFSPLDDGGQGRCVRQVHDVRDGAGAVGQFVQPFLVAGHGVDGQPSLGQAFSDRGTHAGGRAGDEGCGVVGKRHRVSRRVGNGSARSSGPEGAGRWAAASGVAQRLVGAVLDRAHGGKGAQRRDDCVERRHVDVAGAAK